MCEKNIVPHSRHKAGDRKYFVMFAEKAELPCETLQVYAPKRIGLTTMLDLLKKRWKTLDLISVMQELKRTLRAEGISRKQEERMELCDRNIQAVEIKENLSFLPRLQKTE